MKLEKKLVVPFSLGFAALVTATIVCAFLFLIFGTGWFFMPPNPNLDSPDYIIVHLYKVDPTPDAPIISINETHLSEVTLLGQLFEELEETNTSFAYLRVRTDSKEYLDILPYMEVAGVRVFLFYNDQYYTLGRTS